jgi:hypothetical protein
VDDLPRIRRLPGDPALLVVRGDDLDAEIVRADAIRFNRRYPRWGRFGISAYLAADDLEVEALCESRLAQFPLVVVFLRSVLEEAGLEVVPTFRTPHVTIASEDLDALVNRLLACEHREVANTYHQSEQE